MCHRFFSLLVLICVASPVLISADKCWLPLANRTKATTLTVSGTNIPGSDEYHPLVIAGRPDGTSFVSFYDNNANNVQLHIASANDATLTKVMTLSGLEVHAIMADATGATLVVMDNDPDIYASQFCKNATNSQPVCGKLDLVRVTVVGTTGIVAWRTTLTDKINVAAANAIFIWQYAHSARMAYNPSTHQYAVYYRNAISINNNGLIELHAADMFKIVDANTGVRTDSTGWYGCSHSWSVRLAQNNQYWGTICHADPYPADAMVMIRIPYGSPSDISRKFQWLNEQDPSHRALGGLVAAKDGGFWINYYDDIGSAGIYKMTLGAFTNSVTGNGQTPTSSVVVTGINPGAYPFRPYMTRIGMDGNTLLLAWIHNGVLQLSEYSVTNLDNTTLTTTTPSPVLLEGPIPSSKSKIDNFQDIVTAPNGDVVWGWTSGGNSLVINRVQACPAPPPPTIPPITTLPPVTTPAPATTGTWTQYNMTDAFARQNAGTTDPGVTVAVAQAHALLQGFVGFVYCNATATNPLNTAYYRAQNASQLIANRKNITNACDLWVYTENPTTPTPTTKTPTTPVPTAPNPTTPVPTGPNPTTPVPTGPNPTTPVPTGPNSTTPVPTGPNPTTPVPTGPNPTTPVPTDPVPTAPVPTGPVPTTPVPSSNATTQTPTTPMPTDTPSSSSTSNPTNTTTPVPSSSTGTTPSPNSNSTSSSSSEPSPNPSSTGGPTNGTTVVPTNGPTNGTTNEPTDKPAPTSTPASTGTGSGSGGSTSIPGSSAPTSNSTLKPTPTHSIPTVPTAVPSSSSSTGGSDVQGGGGGPPSDAQSAGSSSSSSSSSMYVIIGASIGGVVALLVLFLVVRCIRMKRSRTASEWERWNKPQPLSAEMSFAPSMSEGLPIGFTSSVSNLNQFQQAKPQPPPPDEFNAYQNNPAYTPNANAYGW